MNRTMSEASLIQKNLLRLLARKDYSEKEISEKLSKKYPLEEVQEAIVWAREQRWLKSPQELSEKITEQLNLKLKGIEWIHQVLESKALPISPADPEVELEKARHLIKNKTEERMVSIIFILIVTFIWTIFVCFVIVQIKP